MEKHIYLVRADNDSDWPEDWLAWNVCITLTREQAEREVAKRYPLAVRRNKIGYHTLLSDDMSDIPTIVDLYIDSFAHRGLDRAVRIFVERWPVNAEGEDV